jgi:S1-C subfamily serine protease
MRRLALALVLLLGPALALAAPALQERRVHPREISGVPSYVQRVEPSIVGLHVRAPETAASSARLGSRRFGSAVIFDARGYALTVSYLLLDATELEARTRDGRRWEARLVGLDLDAGLGVIKLEGAGPWAAAPLGRSTDLVAAARTGTVGVDEDGDLVYVAGAVQAIRRFSASWEYMLDRALIVAPASPQWGGSAVVNDRGEVVGIVSLRLGEAPHVNLAIPSEKFLPVKDELIAAGRIVSRPPRPWLGLYTVDVRGGVVVSDFSPAGPAASAGFLKGDRILRVNGVAVASQSEFYEQLWSGRAGDRIEVAVQRDDRVRVIAVTSVDRHRLFRVRD